MLVFASFLLLLLAVIELKTLRDIHDTPQLNHKTLTRFNDNLRYARWSTLFEFRILLLTLNTFYMVTFYLSAYVSHSHVVRWFAVVLIVARLNQVIKQWYVVGTPETKVKHKSVVVTYIRAFIYLLYITLALILH